MTGLLLIQLGTPDAPTAAALKPYLRQFLSDPRVIEDQGWRWKLILNGIILRTPAGICSEIRPHLGRENRLAAAALHRSPDRTAEAACSRTTRCGSE